MKINPTAIIRDHLGTLHNAKTGKLSILDVFVFYALPLAAGLAAYLFHLCVDRDVYNVSITFYGIFVALLLNIQVAIFSILQRKRQPSQDRRISQEQRERENLRRKLLSEVNANISYLVFFCCIALCAFLLF